MHNCSPDNQKRKRSRKTAKEGHRKQQSYRKEVMEGDSGECPIDWDSDSMRAKKRVDHKGSHPEGFRVFRSFVFLGFSSRGLIFDFLCLENA